MNKISVQTIMTTLSSRADGSARMSITTPELSSEEFTTLREMQNQIMQAVFIPMDIPNAPELKIDKDVQGKSQSQRLRNTIYVLYTQSGTTESWESFYHKEMERAIEAYKRRID